MKSINDKRIVNAERRHVEYTPIQLPEEAGPAVELITDNDPELEAHFRRWRQAVIDTVILERKFPY